MNIKQADDFYSSDKRKYIIRENKEFLNWYKQQSNSGYSFLLNLEAMQDLIEKITIWYELKYPNREIEKGVVIDTRFENIKSIANNFTIDQLRYCLSGKQIEVLDCNYRTGWGGLRTIGGYYNDDGVLCDVEGYISLIFLSLFAKEKEIIIEATEKGELVDFSGEVKTLEELLNVLEKQKNIDLDYSNLSKCIIRNKIDKELRERIIYMAALKLLYSKDTVPDNGYYRMKKLIQEFNEYYDLNLSTEVIDKSIDNEFINTQLDVPSNNKSKIIDFNLFKKRR